MRQLGISVPGHLAVPIDDAITRRNAVIHRSLRDLELARAAFEDRSEIGIAPRIVVGRMQHEEIWGSKRGHQLKRKIEIVET